MANTNKPRTLIIEDGTQEFVLENRFGQVIAAVHIRPTDMSIIGRLKTLQEEAPRIIEELDQVSVNPDGSGVDDADYEIVMRLEKRMTDELAKVFDTDEIAQIFAKRSMFSSINGDFFVTIIINALGELIKQEIEKETALTNELNAKAEASRKRTSKYTKRK